MPNTIILIHEKGNPKPAIDMSSGTITELRLDHFVIIEGGMQSGATSVAFHGIDDKGDHFIMETSAAMLEGFYAATVGANQRFENKKR